MIADESLKHQKSFVHKKYFWIHNALLLDSKACEWACECWKCETYDGHNYRGNFILEILMWNNLKNILNLQGSLLSFEWISNYNTLEVTYLWIEIIINIIFTTLLIRSLSV